MAQVLDYSAGFPGAKAIRAAGHSGAVRYFGFPGRRKCATAGELADFTANDIGMAGVFEDTVTTWRGGRVGGARSAQLARAHATAIGFPKSRPIYYAVDQDVVTTGEFGGMLDYLRGAGDADGGPSLVGVYGEADVIDRARDAGVAHFFWQTAAWSRGRHAVAHLYQRIGAVNVGDISCDTNDVLLSDWGQHNLVTTLEDDMAWDTILTSYNGYPAPADQWVTMTSARAEDVQSTMHSAVVPMLGQILTAVTGGAIDQAQVTAALQAGAEKAINTAVLPAIQRLEAALAADNVAEAKAVVAELGNQLRIVA
jgi:hypothetical protein